MMTNRRTIAVVVALLALAATTLATPPNVRYVDVRALGMGGAGITTQNNFSALMYNPALLARCKTQLDIINFQTTLGKDIVDMISVYDDYQDVFDNYDDTTEAARSELRDELAPFDDNPMGFGAYPTLGLTFPNMAIGAYASASVDFRTDLGILEPRAYLQGVGDYVFTGGLSMEVPENLKFNLFPNRMYAGAALKIIRRYQVLDLRLRASDVDIETAFDTLIEESLHGFGVDLGFLYEVAPDRIDVGVKVTDLIASIDGEAPAMLVNVGASFRPADGIVLAADFNDMFFHRGENLFNKLNFGAQVELLPIVDVRGGFGQGYPSVGAGLNLGLLQIDGAIYSIERTKSPGGDGEYNYAARIRLGL